MRCSAHHEQTDAMGFGKCSVPMFSGFGGEAGFCDEPAYGKPPESPRYYSYATMSYHRDDGRYSRYVPGLACVNHGGPPSRVFMDGDAWCAVFGDFEDLQVSTAGFGPTPDAARAELKRLTGKETV
jgi:hypothetical protein